jgi:hypothetical protein
MRKRVPTKVGVYQGHNNNNVIRLKKTVNPTYQLTPQFLVSKPDDKSLLPLFFCNVMSTSEDFEQVERLLSLDCLATTNTVLPFLPRPKGISQIKI